MIFSLAALTMGGAVAAKTFITSKQIKNNSITSADLQKSAVKSSDLGTNAVKSADLSTDAVQSADIQTGAVQSVDIGQGEVTPEDVTMPGPCMLKYAGSDTMEPTLTFARVATLGSCPKQDAASAWDIDWTGSVEGHNGGEISGCVFQLRVDGQPAAAGGGETFGLKLTSVSASALFTGIGAGPHAIEVWAKINVNTSAGNSCTVGPGAAGVAQTVVATEQIS